MKKLAVLLVACSLVLCTSALAFPFQTASPPRIKYADIGGGKYQVIYQTGTRDASGVFTMTQEFDFTVTADAAMVAAFNKVSLNAKNSLTALAATLP